MHKTYLIDGYNLIYASSDLRSVSESFGMERARIELLKALSEFSSRMSCECVVVFDGVAGMGSAPKGVRVLSSGGRSADELIREQSRALGRRVAIVSDDLEIIGTARANMSAAISAKEFATRIDVIAPNSDADRARREARDAARPHRIQEFRERGEKPNSLDDDEIDEWKKLFGE
jgi:predicted RNA-binding protein with PIN domain